MTPSRRTTSRRRLPRAFPLGSLLLILAAAGRSAFAGPESALDYTEPRLDRGQYALLRGDLAPNRHHQSIGDLLSGHYLTAIAPPRSPTSITPGRWPQSRSGQGARRSSTAA